MTPVDRAAILRAIVQRRRREAREASYADRAKGRAPGDSDEKATSAVDHFAKSFSSDWPVSGRGYYRLPAKIRLKEILE